MKNEAFSFLFFNCVIFFGKLIITICCCVDVLRSRQTAMVMSGR